MAHALHEQQKSRCMLASALEIDVILIARGEKNTCCESK